MTPITSRVFRRVASAAHTQAALLRATVPSASITWIAASAGASEMSQYEYGGGIHRMCQRRYVAQQATESNKIANLDRHAELVKETIKKMMSERHDDEDNNSNNQKPISDQELQGKFNYFKKVYDEAEWCLKDLQEVTPDAEDYLEECTCARGALEHAFAAFTELLEDLRRANDSQLEAYREVRHEHACKLKRLRQELAAALVAQPAAAATRKVA